MVLESGQPCIFSLFAEEKIFSLLLVFARSEREISPFLFPNVILSKITFSPREQYVVRNAIWAEFNSRENIGEKGHALNLSNLNAMKKECEPKNEEI